jgi:uncharacterized membrane protein
MKEELMTRVLFAGESWSVTSTHTKGFDSFTTSEYVEGGGALKQAIVDAGFDLTYMPCHVAAQSFPSTRAELDEYDVVLFSDIGSNTLLLPAPVFLQGQTAPDRLALLRDWVLDGGGFGMFGGYMSFQGIEGKANYKNTALAEVLPVELGDGDDRVEVPPGAVAKLVDPGPIGSGLDEVWPPLLGYQRLRPRAGATVVAAFDTDPLLMTGEYGTGRTLAFASDIDAHWAPSGFTTWAGFPRLWRQSIAWLAGQGTA